MRGVLYDLINVLGPFQVFAAINFCKVEFTYNPSASEVAEKITKYFDFSAFD